MQFETVGSGPALVLLPGLGCDRRMWGDVEGHLSPEFTVVHPHVWEAPSLQEAARGVAEILRELNLEGAGVAGLSMGGYTAFELLKGWQDRVRAVAFLDTTAFPDTPDRVEKRHQVLRLIRSGGFDEVVGAFTQSVLSAAQASGPAEKLVETMARDLGPEVFARCVQAILDRGDYTEVLPNLRIPSLFLVGSEDALTPPDVARRMSARVPASEVVVVPGAGHMTPIENPDVVAPALRTFFRRAAL